jgi:hypothetical protein
MGSPSGKRQIPGVRSVTTWINLAPRGIVPQTLVLAISPDLFHDGS